MDAEALIQQGTNIQRHGQIPHMRKSTKITIWEPKRHTEAARRHSEKKLLVVHAVDERIHELRGGKVERNAKGNGDGKRWQRLLKNGQQQQRARQALCAETFKLGGDVCFVSQGRSRGRSKGAVASTATALQLHVHISQQHQTNNENANVARSNRGPFVCCCSFAHKHAVEDEIAKSKLHPAALLCKHTKRR